MGSKNISVPDHVYEKLREERGPDESFGEAIDRLLGRKRLSEFWGAWDDETAADARDAIASSRKRARTRLEKLYESMACLDTSFLIDMLDADEDARVS